MEKIWLSAEFLVSLLPAFTLPYVNGCEREAPVLATHLLHEAGVRAARGALLGVIRAF